MEWPSLVLALINIFPAFYGVKETYIYISPSDTHQKSRAPFCGLCFYIFKMSVQMGKGSACKHAMSLIEGPVFGFNFVSYVIENKMAL
jgi:hypothetical protein